jgi:flagellar basal body-associated protein FliL
MFLVILIILLAFLVGLGIGTSFLGKSHTQYLNEQYLRSVDKAQKASQKNKATAEFWYNESERYKSLLEEHQRFLNK